jgi:hypothetical protein
LAPLMHEACVLANANRFLACAVRGCGRAALLPGAIADRRHAGRSPPRRGRRLYAGGCRPQLNRRQDAQHMFWRGEAALAGVAMPLARRAKPQRPPDLRRFPLFGAAQIRPLIRMPPASSSSRTASEA